MEIRTLCVVGLGYIGLPTALAFARQGVRVFGFDVNTEVVESVNAMHVPFVEAGLAGPLVEVVNSGILSASTTPQYADAMIIAVPTPFLPDKSADLSFIEAAVAIIAPVLTPEVLVVLESTSPPGTTEAVAKWIGQHRPELVDTDGTLVVDVAHCPERVLPGHILEELASNDRLVGGLSARAAERAAALYRVICQGEILITDAKTAELAKCVENSFRDVNVAFANELSLICDRLGVNVWELISLDNHHPRVKILNPGPGVGGHCLAVDPWFIVSAAPEEARLIRLSREINDEMPNRVVQRVKEATEGHDVHVIAALGLAFKADIDDLRESPAVDVTLELAQQYPDACLLAVEPNIQHLPATLSKVRNIALCGYEEALAQSDVVVVLVDHKQFISRPLIHDNVVVVDTRGIWR